MAVIARTNKSDQLDQIDGTAAGLSGRSRMIPTNDNHCRVRKARCSYTVPLAGNAVNDTVELFRFPAGKYRLYLDESFIANTLAQVGCTYEIGHSAFTKLDGTIVAEAPSAFATAVAGAAVAKEAMGPVVLAANKLGYFDVESADGFQVFLTITGAAAIAAETVEALIAYSND